jgi:hypothetical protein
VTSLVLFVWNHEPLPSFSVGISIIPSVLVSGLGKVMLVLVADWRISEGSKYIAMTADGDILSV